MSEPSEPAPPTACRSRDNRFDDAGAERSGESESTGGGHHGHTLPPTALRQRDIRLDFFRGLGMFIIFVSHTPYNALQLYIPARFGFSDATEIFVFCSGMASAIAFGSVFRQRGYAMGTSRIVYRCWQVYWAHISIFLLVVAAMVVADKLFATGGAYARGLNVENLLSGDTGGNLVGLLTLTYVPNLFDILPMYLVILAMVPVVMALSRISRWAVFAFMAGCWLLAATGAAALPAEPWSDRVWFFNPFGWQLVFFTGFAFIMGWLPAPRIDRRAMWAAAVFVTVSVPFCYEPIHTQVALFGEARAAIAPAFHKTTFGLLRLVHFLSLAYLAYALAGPQGRNIRRLPEAFVLPVCKVGQQALSAYMAGQMLAMLGGIAIDQSGGPLWMTVLVNLVGFAVLIAVAYVAAYFKGSPWKAPRSFGQPAS